MSEEIQEMSLQDDAVSRVLLPMSKEDFLHDVEAAEKEIASGKYRSAGRVFDDLIMDERFKLPADQTKLI